MFWQITSRCYLIGWVLPLLAACQLETSAAMPAFTSQLPVVILEESTSVLTNRGHHPSKVTVLAPKDGWVSFSNGIVAYCGSADVWLRGNSSRFLPKKSYRLELHNDSGTVVSDHSIGEGTIAIFSGKNRCP